MVKEVEPEIKQLEKFLALYNRESDRGAALTARARFEDHLEEIIRAFLIDTEVNDELFKGGNAPLGTLSSKTKLAYTLGLIEKQEYDQINVIRNIGNEFAHEWGDISFEKGRVRDLAMNLTWRGPEVLNKDDPRTIFNFAVAGLSVDLLWRTRLVEREKRTIKDWPNKSYYKTNGT